MKDFAQEYLKSASLPHNTDPYLYLTPQVQEEIIEMQGSSFSNINLSQVIALLLTAPLTTITASLQLSVKPHKQLFQEPESKSKQLARVNTALTLQEKRRMELMLRAGGQQRPYTAPVYEGYRGVIKGLASQGWKAFFKGLFFRTIHQLGHYYAFYQVGISQSNQKGFAETLSVSLQIIKLWLLQSACDISLNVFHIAENRYILQNNIAEFRVFRNGSKVIQKMYERKQAFKGLSYHIINSSFDAFCRLPLYLSLASGFNLASMAILYSTEVILYPLNTAFRRITCQQPGIPGMIPLRYSGIFHALRLILSQEGLIGLYRGFGLHHVTLAVRLTCLTYLSPMLLKMASQG